MSIELEQRDLLNRTTNRTVLKPGQAVLLNPGSLIRPEVHIHAISEDEVEVRVERLGRRAGEIDVTPTVLTREQINSSKRTFNYLGGLKVSWRP